MFGNAVSNVSFRFLEGVSAGHHDVSHHQKDADKLQQYQLINRWHVEQYAYLLRKLRSMKEGDSNVLDNSMVLFSSALSDGNSHDPHRLPLVLGGRSGGRIDTGQHLSYSEDSPSVESVCIHAGRLRCAGGALCRQHRQADGCSARGLVIGKAGVIALFLAVCAWAGDLSGIWIGQLPTRNGEYVDIAFKFTQDGARARRQALRRLSEHAGSWKGKVTGDQVAFVVVAQEQAGNQINETRSVSQVLSRATKSK